MFLFPFSWFDAVNLCIHIAQVSVSTAKVLKENVFRYLNVLQYIYYSV